MYNHNAYNLLLLSKETEIWVELIRIDMTNLGPILLGDFQTLCLHFKKQPIFFLFIEIL